MMTEEEQIVALVESHRERFGRLDVLVNNAGVGIGEAMHEITAKKLDIQIGTNLRGVIIATREALPMLKEAGAEHGKALIVNTASIAGKTGPGVAVGLLGDQGRGGRFSQATQKEHDDDGIQVTALCPGFVDTPMTEFVKEQVPAEEMIRPEDIAEAVRYLLRTSPVLPGPRDRVHAARGDALARAVAQARSSSRSVASSRSLFGARRRTRIGASAGSGGATAARDLDVAGALAALGADLGGELGDRDVVERGVEVEAALEQRAQLGDLAAGGAPRAGAGSCTRPRRGRRRRRRCGRRCDARRASGRCRRIRSRRRRRR